MASHPSMLSDNEMDCLTSAFRSLETSLRGATIDQEDIQAAMLMVGLNPSDQECVDIPNEYARLEQNFLCCLQPPPPSPPNFYILEARK